MKHLLALIALVASSAFAEVRQDAFSFVARTNATSAVAVTSDNRGWLYRFKLVVSGTTLSNTLVIADTDGSVIYSNPVGSGTSYVSFTNNPVPFVGLIFSTFGATTNIVTNTVTTTFQR